MFEIGSIPEESCSEDMVAAGADNDQVMNVNVEGLVFESLNYAVIDSACTSTVFGEEWLQCYMDSLDKTKC